MSFPLLRCPYLVGAEILKNMPHQELFLLSLVSKKAKKAIKMCLPKRYLTAELQTRGYGTVVTQHGTEKRHFRLRNSSSELSACLIGNPYAEVQPRNFSLLTGIDELITKTHHFRLLPSSSGIPCMIGDTYAKVHPLNSQSLIDIDWKSDKNVALKSFISHINICWNSPRIFIKMDEEKSSDYFPNLMTHLNLNAITVDSVEFATNVRWDFGEYFLQCKSVKLYYKWRYHYSFNVKLVNFLEMLANSPENKLEVITILECKITTEEITNGLNEKGIVHEVAGSKLELQRCDGKKVLISLVDQVLEVKVV
ncbi:unnamed protein product [Caenorhabditis brenneri]